MHSQSNSGPELTRRQGRLSEKQIQHATGAACSFQNQVVVLAWLGEEGDLARPKGVVVRDCVVEEVHSDAATGRDDQDRAAEQEEVCERVKSPIDACCVCIVCIVCV